MENKWGKWLKDWCEHPKFPKKTQLVTIFLVGVLLLVIAWPTSKEEQNNQEERENLQMKALSDEERYQEYLEQRIARALEQVEGVGKTEVVITLKSTAEKVIEKDSSKSSQSTDEKDSTGGTRLQEE